MSIRSIVALPLKIFYKITLIFRPLHQMIPVMLAQVWNDEDLYYNICFARKGLLSNYLQNIGCLHWTNIFFLLGTKLSLLENSIYCKRWLKCDFAVFIFKAEAHIIIREHILSQINSNKIFFSAWPKFCRSFATIRSTPGALFAYRTLNAFSNASFKIEFPLS